MTEIPGKQGLYRPENEHDSCGVSFICHLKGEANHNIVELGLQALCNLEHRGATGSEANSGDGAGILVQIPDRFFRSQVSFDLPPVGQYASGIGFLPQDPGESARIKKRIEQLSQAEGLEVLGWREVPVQTDSLGSYALASMPSFHQLFLAKEGLSGIDLDRRVYIARKHFQHEITMQDSQEGVYFASLSSRTFVYKGMLTTGQLEEFFPDLQNEQFASAIALLHSRFSTNTFPSWPLAHPYRFIAHNGEINTVKGNRNWMLARESLLKSDVLPGDMDRLFPICTPGASDSASFDEVLELLHLGGYSLPEAILMMVPEPWERHDSMPETRRLFYQYKASMMEAWDGPASIAFTDGTTIGAILDRNGLRPSRYWVTDEGLVVMASEVGVVDIGNAQIVEKGRLEPGKMFLIDTQKGRIIRDKEIKDSLAMARPYQEWLDKNRLHLSDLPQGKNRSSSQDSVPLEQLQQTFGYTFEDLRLLISPMARDSSEALGSMGTDTPLAVLSHRPRLVFDYFTQLFAQVTNPPLDAIREKLVTSVGGTIGSEGNLLHPSETSCRHIQIDHPVITNEELGSLLAAGDSSEMQDFSSTVLSSLYAAGSGELGLRDAIRRLQSEALQAVLDKKTILVLSDRGTNSELLAVPSLLATAAVHHHLVKNRVRSKVSVLIETAEAREVHHFALLLGYGATAINPYLAFETIKELVADQEYGLGDLHEGEALQNYILAVDKGVLKVLSKMGISTVSSYRGAQIFEAIGLHSSVIDEYFCGTNSSIEGAGLDTIAAELQHRHDFAYPANSAQQAHRTLDAGGEYQWRREGEFHLFNPETVFKLQHATRQGRYDVFKEYTTLVDDQSKQLATLRGMLSFKTDVREPISVDEVEPVSEIVKRFSTGAMSYGSLSKEVHETLAIAMNRLGAKSNTGEGGEDPERYVAEPNGDSKRSAIKQVASGRFGVTSEYLVQADDIQIKMAQGAKPGEGGHLPGKKVFPPIAKTRHSTTGVGLISPPPHHDIYSIEDLAQLIFDLKNANPDARVHVKLVSETGVGTIAAGVSKAHADVVLVSGHDGGTGASPLTSLKHAGSPWELGLAETQQTLLMNDLRDRIVVQVDGQLKTGRDVLIAALLGADEFGFATAPLVVSGCVMMRVCHLNTCPVGVATQDPELRKKFTGTPEFVINFFEYIAEEVRELLASLGFRSLSEAIGQVEVLAVDELIELTAKTKGIDLGSLLHVPHLSDAASRSHTSGQDHGLDTVLDQKIIRLAEPALTDKDQVTIDLPVSNTDRATATLLGSEVTKKYGGEGLEDDTITLHLSGSVGNSLAAFVPKGITVKLVGDANDFVGKGLSGGRIILRPAANLVTPAEDNSIAGNVILYGATSGEVYIRGRVGERFCVRNSGAIAVVEGVGDHGCEYMTGGKAVILGSTGRNFAAGMSGGVAYVYDQDGMFSTTINPEMVDLDPLDAADFSWLKQRIGFHQEETDSAVAKRILEGWESEASLFVKVMPRDYKKVLQASSEARASGVDETAAIMAAVAG